MGDAVVPVHDGLFTDDHLLGGCCRACSRHHFPRTETCPHCSSSETEDADLSPTGTLWGWTAVTAAPPGYRGEVPFGFGVVELPEGIRVVTRLTEADPARLTFAMPVRMRVVPLHTDDDGRTVTTFAFEAAGS
jgi:uncharacterized OB-fold protein